MKHWKVIAALACGMLVTAPAWADTRDDVLGGVARCGVIHDDRIWLDCVYGAQQPMRAKLGLSPAPELQQRLVPGPNVAPPPGALATNAPPRPAPPRPRNKKLGFFGTLLNDTPDSEAIRMTSYRYEKNGAFVVALENGQEWRQTDVIGGAAVWNNQASTYRVVITKGLAGNYKLRTTDNMRVYGVERVR